MNIKRGLFFLLVICITVGATAGEKTELNEISHFISPSSSGDSYYFSLINKRYTWDVHKRYLYDGLLEIVKFVSLELEMFKEQFTYGSHVIYRDDIKATIDAEIATEIAPFIKPVKLYETDEGDVLVLKIGKADLSTVWAKYNSGSLPSFSLDISNEIKDGYPLWFLKPPQFNNYVIGVGYFSSSTSAQVNFKEADYQARIEVIKTIKLLLNSGSEMYSLNDTFELYNFFNETGAKANMGGIYIIKRYYDERTGGAFSLAALKMQ